MRREVINRIKKQATQNNSCFFVVFFFKYVHFISYPNLCEGRKQKSFKKSPEKTQEQGPELKFGIKSENIKS